MGPAHALAPEVASAGRIKGVALRQFVICYERARGREAAERACSTLGDSPFRANEAALGILQGTWYSARQVHALLDALLAPLDMRERDRLITEAAADVMTANLNTVYRAIFSAIATPSLYRRYAQKFWNMYFDTGNVQYVGDEPGRHRSQVSGWTGHHPIICALNEKANATIYAAMGCRNVTVTRAACVSRGARYCEYVMQWES